MAYGRLDVFFPDGVFKTFLLTTSPVSIGRSTGNTIPLETDTISRYHLSLTQQDGQVTLVDMESANGTFLDGERVKHNAPHTLYGGEEILIGDLRIIFHNLDDSPTRPVNVPEETLTHHEQRVDADFRVEVENPAQAIPPGAHIAATVTIYNTSAAAQHYQLEVEGMPKGWTRIDRPDVEIQPGEHADIILSFKPIRRYDSAPGDYVAQITIRPRGNTEKALVCPVRLRVLPYGGFGVALAARSLETDGQFRLYVQNQGSAPLPIALMGRDLPNRLRFTFPMASMTLAPGQRAAIDGRVRARQPMLFGEARSNPFDLIVRSCDSAGFLVATRGYLNEKPLLPTWAGFAIGGIGLSLVALLILSVILLLRPNIVPSIAAFTLSSTRVAQGAPLQVDWQVQNAEQVSLALVESSGTGGDETLTELASIDLRTNTTQIDTSALNGVVRVVLIALNGDQNTRAEQSVFVYAPLMVTRFDFQPARLVRYVTQTVTVDWEVSGALSTRLSGVESWSQAPLDSAYPAAATVSVSGIPTAPIELVLSAQNADGEAITQSLAIPVIDPSCTAGADNTPLYAGPDITHQVYSNASANTPLVVDGRTLDGAWLRFPLSGGAAGWGQRAAFVCADTFNPDQLRIEANLPPTPTPLPTLLPPPTRTPSRTPTPSAATRTAQPPTPTTAG
ncbi:MAG: FHA domain-containing protein [Chloroflexota bacterium]|nr:FHA domain-containing protein [Chloroflexota bacterium]